MSDWIIAAEEATPAQNEADGNVLQIVHGYSLHAHQALELVLVHSLKVIVHRLSALDDAELHVFWRPRTDLCLGKADGHVGKEAFDEEDGSASKCGEECILADLEGDAAIIQ